MVRKPLVYVETTIPSSYHTRRTTPAEVARRDWTREWWDWEAGGYELVTSKPVQEELLKGPAEFHEAWLKLLNECRFLVTDPATKAIVSAYEQHKLMPLIPVETQCNWRSPPFISATFC